MHPTERNDRPVQSETVPTVLLRWVRDPEYKVPLWRHLAPVEEGVEENLANMSPEGAANLRSQHAMARRALEEGQWETALSSFTRCRDILKGEALHVEKFQSRSFRLLLLWAASPLAQMYQLRGRMLHKAVETWRELLDGVMPSLRNPAQLDSNLLSFLYTAEYECGSASGDSEMMAQAMQSYAALMGCHSKAHAERELCLLLSYDHFWYGSFEDSLKWILRANGLWKGLLPPAVYLRWEVYVLMKLQRFHEASSALDRLCSAEVSILQAERRAEEVRRWRQDCDMQLQKINVSGVHLQEALEDEEMLELQHALEYSLTLNSSQVQAAHGPGHDIMAASTSVNKIMDEIMTPDSATVRSWLSIERLDNVQSHISKLPEGPGVAFFMDMQRSLNAAKQKQFRSAIFQLNCCRGILRTIKKCIEDEAYYSILASVDHLLADMYQFCEFDLVCQVDKALEIRKELLNCMEHIEPSDRNTQQHYMSLVILTEYQECSPEDAVSREQPVLKYASLMGMKKEEAECDICFWLLFRDNCLWTKLRRLENEVMPRWEHSGTTLPHLHLMRCQVELLLDVVNEEEYDLELVKMILEKAEGILKDLTQHYEGQSSYEAWIHSMLEDCYLKMSKRAKTAGDHEGAGGYEEMAEVERALHLSVVQELGLHQSKKPPAIAVSNRSQLIQADEQIMEQYYWVRFPPAHYLAFRKLYDTGRYAQDEGDWDSAIFYYELCRDLLKDMKTRFKSADFDCSLAWICIPLVELYQMKTKNLKKSLDLRKELRDCLGSLRVDSNYVKLAVHANFHAAIYHFSHSKYPSFVDKIMAEIIKLVPKPSAGKRPEIWEFFICSVGPKYWEYYLVTTLLIWHYVQGDYETALDVVGVLKQVVEKHFPDDQEKIDQNVIFEATCLMELKMFQDADLVFEKARKGKSKEKLSRPIQQAMLMCTHGISGIHAALFEASRNVALYYLRITGAYAQLGTVKRYKEAAYLYTLCIKIIEAAKKDPANKNERHLEANIISEYRGQPGWYDYFQLGISLRKFYEAKMRSYRESSWNHPNSSNVELEAPSIQDPEFSSALLSFQQQIKLLVNPAFIARANHEIFKLYAAMDESYLGYLLIRKGLKDAHAMHFDLGIADVNNVKLMEDEHLMKEALTETERSILEEVQATLIKYGRRTSLQFANSLYAMKGRYTESWINMLEGHKDVYAKLQKHYLNKMFLEALTLEGADNPGVRLKLDEFRWKAFLYAERQRSRVLLYQLGPQKLTSHVARELWEFDTNDLHAIDTIQAHVAELEKDSVFVEFNHLQEDVWIIYVVQDGTLSHYLLTMKLEMKRLKEAIKNILLLVNGKKKTKVWTYDDVQMNKDLEYLHDLLINPIASHLSRMKTQHKLILAPTELLAKVPFAALQDCTKAHDKKYLVQRHTISFVPSLRAFKRCNDRLKTLRELDPYVGQGAIVALGDPTYGRDGRKEPLPPLFGTNTEVEDISNMFPQIPVVKLLKEDATVGELLHWIENPLHKSSRQAIVHIGAHGKVDELDDRNSCLFLAASISRTTSTGHELIAESRMFDDLDMDDEENKDSVGTINEESARTLSDAVCRTVNEVKRLSKEEKGKDKVDEGKDLIEEILSEGEEELQAEMPIEKLIEWAEKSINEVTIKFEVFVEYPELQKIKAKLTRKLGPHVCSILTLKDISDSKVPWRAELVVLSACHTSEGKATAEGLMNLARAFIIAGVPCVVASQWSVLDDSTPVLMKRFYDQLRHGHDVASSLRSAMSSMIEAGFPMQAWCPFVIWGSSSLLLPEYLHCGRT
ncbi:hypothetical protein M758_11G130500 [Ceratodon purpureus]|nr:hypothetical protein M758_11G130500 [Ceratodon purpureus]KAG0601669.1 hypothetical protein M758_11G130500 [Ceratodon purpureus]